MTGSRIYVPGDATACSVGADAVAAAINAHAGQAGLSVELIRNGSRGMHWLEPLVEVDTDQGRLAYGPVTADDVPGLFAAGFHYGGAHALRLGPTGQLPWMRQQERLSFARCGVVDPRSLADYRRHGGYAGLEKALTMTPEAIVEAVTESGLRGRGGAAFPTGIKWKTVLEAPVVVGPDRDDPRQQKYIVCNADEGDSGTFADRMLMEGDPFSLIEGMTLAALATGATQGFIYLRSEYPHAHRALTVALSAAYEAGYLGVDVCGSGKRFDLEVRLGAGAYICGEETALLDSLEGRRGQVRAKPPLPAINGLFGQPTAVNNVLTLAAVPEILARGAAHYRDFGRGRSRGTLAIQLAGNVKRGGLIEKAFGVTVREIIEDFGGGTRSGRPVRAVQIGGPLGAYWPPEKFDTPLDYEAFIEAGGMVGHGGIVVFDDSVNLAEQARYAMEFCAIESCGKCTPCRIGSVRGVEVIDRLTAGDATQETLLRDLCDTLTHGSLCAMGGMTPIPVLSALDHFAGDFRKAFNAKAQR
ncbi:formate dehydrogenase beta subunit [Polycyclovorans algicola]|uniref:formate dehydrogenase beta subunit n=1 Tax=Polycyclovorans algicola TaxID=616992 RepID=UPI0004A74104|nr:formate dehydrogenase beta subunit [Polycyclovorans algicola]